MKRLLFSGLILLILFLILVPEVLALEQDEFVTRWKSSEGGENQLNTIQNLAASDASTPITIELTQSKIPLVNEETTFHIEINSIFVAPGTNVKIILPKNVELISGSLERTIDLQANTPESFETVIKFTQPGNYKITASAHKIIDQENSWGDMDVIYLTIGEVSSKISTYRPIAYAERAQSASEKPRNNSEISTHPQYLTSEPPRVVMPNELPLDRDVKSAGSNFIYSPQNSPNNTIQGTGTLTVNGTWGYYTKVIGGEIADYRDTDDTRVPLEHAIVYILDNSTSTWLGYGYTDDNGGFSINIPNPYPNSFYVYVWAYSAYTDPGATSRELRVVYQGSTLSGFTDVWTVYAGPFTSTDGSHTQNIGPWYPPIGGDWEHAFMLFQDLIRARDFIGWDVGSSTILWYPTSSDGNHIHLGGQIHLTGETYKSADTSIHEFGHNYMWTKRGSWTNTCPSPHYITKGNNTQCAYTEGWADFLPLTVNNNSVYTWASGATLNLETPTWGTPNWDNGDGCEGRVAGALWDTYDTINDGYDEYQIPYSFNDATMKHNTGWTFSDFWNTWKSLGYSSDADWSIYQNTIDYFPPPTITNISPNFGLNNGTVHTTIIGSDFLLDPLVGLAKNNIPYILATQYTLNSPQNITCDFNLTGAEAGQWNVVVVNLGGQYGILNNGFTILNATPTLPPVASFSVNVTSGISPLAVKFTDTSLNTPTTWNWSFTNVTGNNTQTWFSTEQNPAYPFGTGNYSIVLNAGNSAGYNLSTQITFINVSAPTLPPVASFTAAILLWNSELLPVSFFDTSTNTPTAWNWSFRNVTGNNTQVWFSTVQNPEHTFGVGNYSIVLNASNSAGYNLSTQVTFINVSAVHSTTSSKIGVFRNSTHLFYLDFNGNGVWNGASGDRQYNFGISGDIPISGDWDKNGISEIGVFRNSTHMFYLDYNGNGVWNGALVDRQYNFGISGDIPIAGDWNSDGKTEIGVFRNSTHLFYLDYDGNGAWNGAVTDRSYNFGISGDIPVSGDWNIDGRTEIGVFRPSTHLFYLDYNGNGVWNGGVTDRSYNFGITGDMPISGDWNNDGKSEIGVFRNSTHLFYLDYNGNGAWNGAVTDKSYNFGITGDIPVSGKWG